MKMHEARTYQVQLMVATARLKSVGLDRPRREARHLMQHVCGLTATGLINCETSLMEARDCETFFDLIERRASGEPYEYLTGEAWFCGLSFTCTADTLIPRADSEVVVDEALTRLPLGREARIADLGTGTGCLLIALMKQQPGLRGTGIDRSAKAAAVARTNVQRHGLEARGDILTLSWGDWTGWSDVDLVISNPPYIRSDVIGTLDTSVKSYEPHLALDGGTSGLEAYKQIIALAGPGMKPGAWIVFEIGFDQATDVRSLLEKAGFEAISVAQDMGQRDRVVTARR